MIAFRDMQLRFFKVKTLLNAFKLIVIHYPPPPIKKIILQRKCYECSLLVCYVETNTQAKHLTRITRPLYPLMLACLRLNLILGSTSSAEHMYSYLSLIVNARKLLDTCIICMEHWLSCSCIVEYTMSKS